MKILIPAAVAVLFFWSTYAKEIGEIETRANMAVDSTTCKQKGKYCCVAANCYPCCDPDFKCRVNPYGNQNDGVCVPKQTSGTEYCKASGKFCCRKPDCYPCCDSRYKCKLNNELGNAGNMIDQEGKCVPYDAADMTHCKKDGDIGCDKPDQDACCSGLLCFNHRSLIKCKKP